MPYVNTCPICTCAQARARGAAHAAKRSARAATQAKPKLSRLSRRETTRELEELARRGAPRQAAADPHLNLTRPYPTNPSPNPDPLTAAPRQAAVSGCVERIL